MALGHFLEALATVLEVPVDLLEWLAVHPKHRHAVIEQLVVQAAKVGEIEWEPTIKRIAKVMSKVKMLKAA